ncbi:Cadherin,Cadherin-like,Cadherin conserved site [Cinara cedri]|uniref:Cadherin,Cadherin-like,Cadherin conserved site n=1 Tax=Cinara cedri TaxID=506608 RepID=A0A5E4M0W2_9HEMI|nr:Cadherin,Cadherin-like,Cadherin conserved site [Cinara cedri]
MVGTRSSFYLFCTILICFSSDSFALNNTPGNEQKENTREIKSTAGRSNDDAGPDEYPFDEPYYSYKTIPIKLVKNTQLNPPIAYKTPNGYSLVLEPITRFCKNVNASVFAKFSTRKFENHVYINVDDDLTDLLQTGGANSTIVYKLKTINDVDSNVIGGETIVIVTIFHDLPVLDHVLEFEESNYSIKLSYGRKGKVYRFNVIAKTVTATGLNEKYDNSDLLNELYTFKGNYSLEYLPDQLLSNLRISRDGDLEVIGNIIEGFYSFDVVAVDFSPNHKSSSAVLKTKSRVNLFVDSVAVCSSEKSKFIKAFSKHYLTEETKLQTAIPASGSDRNCTFAISHQYPLGDGTDFFKVDPATGAVNVINPVDREAYSFEDMDEPSVYLKLKVHCPPPDEPTAVQPLHLADTYNIAYDPTVTLVQLVIEDANDNPPVFPDRRVVVGYPGPDVADAVAPKHVAQVKATDKDAGKHGKIQYTLRGDDANDFVVNPETGTIYCARPMDNCVAEKTFQVVAKDNDGKPEGSESTMNVTVKLLKYTDVVRVNVPFSTTEDEAAVESQLSDISGFRVMSLVDNVINTYADGRWRTERTMVVYAVDNSDGSVISASGLESKLEGNPKILKISRVYPEDKSKRDIGSTDNTGIVITAVYVALFCLMLSMVALSLLYFGYFKNGLYLSCISSTSTTPLKDDMENMSQSNWITTFNRSNLSSTRVRFPAGKINSSASRSKAPDNTAATASSVVIVENSLYEAIPPKRGKACDDDPSGRTTKLDCKLCFEDDLIKLEKMEEVFSPTDDDKCFSY